MSKFRFKQQSVPIKSQLCNINVDWHVFKTIVGLRTDHYKGMKIDRYGMKSYCVQLTLAGHLTLSDPNKDLMNFSHTKYIITEIYLKICAILKSTKS